MNRIVAVLLLAGLAAAQTGGMCGCRMEVFPECLVPGGNTTPGMCTKYECQGWVCTDQSTTTTCEILEAAFPIRDGAGDGDMVPCKAEYVNYAMPVWAAETRTFIEWSWDGHSGPRFWGLKFPDCDGQAQSPIDFEPAINIEPLPADTPSTFGEISSHSAVQFSVTQVKGAPLYSCATAAGCGTLTWNGLTYTLVQFHMHSPSEHTINGIHYAHEMHFVHFNEASGTYAVIGSFWEAGASELNAAVENLWSCIDCADEEIVTVNPADLFSVGDTFYTYGGSFTTPPCTEIVTFFIGQTIYNMAPSQYVRFNTHIGGYPGDSRPIQPLNGRVIQAGPAPTVDRAMKNLVTK